MSFEACRKMVEELIMKSERAHISSSSMSPFQPLNAPLVPQRQNTIWALEDEKTGDVIINHPAIIHDYYCTLCEYRTLSSEAFSLHRHSDRHVENERNKQISLVLCERGTPPNTEMIWDMESQSYRQANVTDTTYQWLNGLFNSDEPDDRDQNEDDDDDLYCYEKI